MMKDLELVINELIEFILLNHVESIPEYYYDVFLNYLGVTYLGSKNSDIDVVINSCLLYTSCINTSIKWMWFINKINTFFNIR